MAAAAEGSVREVESILKDQYLTAPCDGEIADIFPNEGELVSTGTPIMNVLKTDNRWLVFNVRETMLKDLPMGERGDSRDSGIGADGCQGQSLLYKRHGRLCRVARYESDGRV